MHVYIMQNDIFINPSAIERQKILRNAFNCKMNMKAHFVNNLIDSSKMPRDKTGALIVNKDVWVLSQQLYRLAQADLIVNDQTTIFDANWTLIKIAKQANIPIMELPDIYKKLPTPTDGE